MAHISRLPVILLLLITFMGPDPEASAQRVVPRGQKWVATWAASAHGPYPSGNASAQPVLDLAFESPERGAVDQTFRLIVKPDLWGHRFRLRFSNAFGTQRVTFDDVFVGVQNSGGTVVAGTNARVGFERGRTSLTLAPGASAFSDPVDMPIATRGDRQLLAGRKLAVSFHVAGPSGPMTWHAKALTTSYVSAPHGGSHGADLGDDAFPYTSTSWYFLDAIDVEAADRTGGIL